MLEFAKISTCKERPQLNESLQITIEELKRGIKMMRNGRSFGLGEIAAELVKYGGHYLDMYLL
jgi:hypothetical protein